MIYGNLYRLNALDGGMLSAITIKKAALLVALDQDTRDQSEVEAELPDGSDFAASFVAFGTPTGALKIAASGIERAFVRSIEKGVLKPVLCAKNLSDEIDTNFTLLSIGGVEKWLDERDISLNFWWQAMMESETDFLGDLVDTVVSHRYPADPKSDKFDESKLVEYQNLDAEQQTIAFQKLLKENYDLQQKSSLEAPSQGKELSAKERISLLVLIEVLANQVCSELSDTPHKKAEAIGRLVDRCGVSMAVNTISKFLKDAPKALELRKRTSD